MQCLGERCSGTTDRVSVAVAFELLRHATMELRYEESDGPSEFVPEQILPVQFAEPGCVRRLLCRWQAAQTPRAQGLAKIPSVRRIAGSRHTVTGRAPGLRDSRRLAS
jgi:hypothetical protein